MMLTTKLAHPFHCLLEGWRAPTARFSNFVVTNHPLK